MIEHGPLAELADFGPYFTITVTPPNDPAVHDHPARGGTGAVVPVIDLLGDPTTLGSLVDGAAASMGTDDRALATSILYQAWAARLTSIWAGSLLLYGWAPNLAAARVRCRLPLVGGPIPLTLDHLDHLDADRAWHGLYDEHLMLLGDALRGIVRIGRPLLIGNIAASLAGSLAVLQRTPRGGQQDLRTLPWTTRPELTRFGDWSDDRPSHFVRTTCCGYERLPGGSRCGDCSLNRIRPSLRRAATDKETP